MFSVRLITVDSYQAQPLPQLDPTFSEFRGSEIKHVPVIRIFGITPNGEKTCLHIHGIFPYLFVPYTGEEDAGILAYRLAASLDAAINVSLGTATSNTQHVYSIQRVSGTPFYGYHRKEHQFLKIYFYNPAMVKRAADLLQNGSVLNGSLQPHESHINYILQFMMDYNIYGMSLINLRSVKHRRLTQTLGDLASSGQSVNSENNDIIYLPARIERQSTCEIEIDALASDITNRLEIEKNLDLNPGLAAIWDEERARRAQAGLEGGNSQLVNPKSPPRPTFNPTDNDVYQEQRLARRLLMISQCDESTMSTVPNRSVAYAAEVQDGENLLNSCHVGNISVQTVEKSPFPRDDSLGSFLDSPIIAASQNTQDSSILGTDDMPLVDLLVQLADEGNEKLESVDTDSVLGSQLSVLLNDEKSENEDEDVADLNLTCLQLDSLGSLEMVVNPVEPVIEMKNSSKNTEQSSVMNDNPILSPWEISSCSSKSTNDDEDDNSKRKETRNCRLPQYDGAGDVSPTLLNSDNEDVQENRTSAKDYSHLPEYNGTCDIITESRKLDNREKIMKITSRTSNGSLMNNITSEITIERSGNNDNCQNSYDESLSHGDTPLAITNDNYLVNDATMGYSHFDRLLEIGTDFVPDLEVMHTSMDIGILMSSEDSDKAESLDDNQNNEIPIETVLNGDPCFTESAELDKSDLAELHDQYLSLFGNVPLPDVHKSPRVENDLSGISSGNFVENDISMKSREITENSHLPRESIVRPDSSSSSENVEPNIQEPEIRGMMKNKLNNAIEPQNCVELGNTTTDNSDHNCNVVVATWAELQNLQIVEKSKIDGRPSRTRNEPGKFPAAPRSMKRRGIRLANNEKVPSQVLRNNLDKISFHASNNCPSSPSKIVQSCGKSPIKRISSSLMMDKSIPIMRTLSCDNVMKNCELKLSSGTLANISRLSQSSFENENEREYTPLRTAASLDAFHRSIIGSENPLVKNALSNDKYSPYSPNENDNVNELDDSEETLENCTKNCVDNVDEILENRLASHDDSSSLEENFACGVSHYSSEQSHNVGGIDINEHRHCYVSKFNQFLEGDVFTSDQVWIIQKRKRGKPTFGINRPSVCTSKKCRLPVVRLRKIEPKGNVEIVASPENDEKSTNENLSEATCDENNKASENSSSRISQASMENEKSPEENKSSIGRKSRPRRRRNGLIFENNDDVNGKTSVNHYVSEPNDPVSRDWAKKGDRWANKFIHSADHNSRDRYNTRKHSSIVEYVKRRRRCAKKLNAAEETTINRKKPRARTRYKEDNLPGIPGIVSFDLPKKRCRTRNIVFSCHNRNTSDSSTTIEELKKPKKIQPSKLFPNWGAKCEMPKSLIHKKNDESPSNGLVIENYNNIASSPVKSASPKPPLAISPIPKSKISPSDKTKNSLPKYRNFSSTPENQVETKRKDAANILATQRSLSESVTLNLMMRESKSHSTRAKLRLILEKRLSQKSKSSDKILTKLSKSSEKTSEDKIVVTPVVTETQIDETIEPKGDDEIKSVEKNTIENIEPVEQLSIQTMTDTSETIGEKDCEQAISLDPTTEICNSREFDDSTLSAEFCSSVDGETSDIFEADTAENSVIAETTNVEELSNETKQLVYDTDRYENAIKEANFFAGKDYTIDAVSLEIPTCLFEEDSNSVDKRMPKKVVENNVENFEDSYNTTEDSSSEMSIDPRDLDVYDVESLTPSSSLSALDESIDTTESLFEGSETDDHTISESRTNPDCRNKSLGEIPTIVVDGEEMITEHESSFEEASPAFEALSPSPQISSLLGKSLEEEFSVHSTIEISVNPGDCKESSETISKMKNENSSNTIENTSIGVDKRSIEDLSIAPNEDLAIALSDNLEITQSENLAIASDTKPSIATKSPSIDTNEPLNEIQVEDKTNIAGNNSKLDSEIKDLVSQVVTEFENELDLTEVKENDEESVSIIDIEIELDSCSESLKNIVPAIGDKKMLPDTSRECRVAEKVEGTEKLSVNIEKKSNRPIPSKEKTEASKCIHMEIESLMTVQQDDKFSETHEKSSERKNSSEEEIEPSERSLMDVELSTIVEKHPKSREEVSEPQIDSEKKHEIMEKTQMEIESPTIVDKNKELLESRDKALEPQILSVMKNKIPKNTQMEMESPTIVDKNEELLESRDRALKPQILSENKNEIPENTQMEMESPTIVEKNEKLLESHEKALEPQILAEKKNKISESTQMKMESPTIIKTNKNHLESHEKVSALQILSEKEKDISESTQMGIKSPTIIEEEKKLLESHEKVSERQMLSVNEKEISESTETEMESSTIIEKERKLLESHGRLSELQISTEKKKGTLESTQTEIKSSVTREEDNTIPENHEKIMQLQISSEKEKELLASTSMETESSIIVQRIETVPESHEKITQLEISFEKEKEPLASTLMETESSMIVQRTETVPESHKKIPELQISSEKAKEPLASTSTEMASSTIVQTTETTPESHKKISELQIFSGNEKEALAITAMGVQLSTIVQKNEILSEIRETKTTLPNTVNEDKRSHSNIEASNENPLMRITEKTVPTILAMQGLAPTELPIAIVQSESFQKTAENDEELSLTIEKDNEPPKTISKDSKGPALVENEVGASTIAIEAKQNEPRAELNSESTEYHEFELREEKTESNGGEEKTKSNAETDETEKSNREIESAVISKEEKSPENVEKMPDDVNKNDVSISSPETEHCNSNEAHISEDSSSMITNENHSPETPKNRVECRPVSIQLVNIDLSKIRNFVPQKHFNSKVEEPACSSTIQQADKKEFKENHIADSDEISEKTSSLETSILEIAPCNNTVEIIENLAPTELKTSPQNNAEKASKRMLKMSRMPERRSIRICLEMTKHDVPQQETATEFPVDPEATRNKSLLRVIEPEITVETEPSLNFEEKTSQESLALPEILEDIPITKSPHSAQSPIIESLLQEKSEKITYVATTSKFLDKFAEKSSESNISQEIVPLERKMTEENAKPSPIKPKRREYSVKSPQKISQEVTLSKKISTDNVAAIVHSPKKKKSQVQEVLTESNSSKPTYEKSGKTITDKMGEEPKPDESRSKITKTNIVATSSIVNSEKGCRANGHLFPIFSTPKICEYLQPKLEVEREYDILSKNLQEIMKIPFANDVDKTISSMDESMSEGVYKEMISPLHFSLLARKIEEAKLEPETFVDVGKSDESLPKQSSLPKEWPQRNMDEASRENNVLRRNLLLDKTEMEHLVTLQMQRSGVTVSSELELSSKESSYNGVEASQGSDLLTQKIAKGNMKLETCVIHKKNGQPRINYETNEREAPSECKLSSDESTDGIVEASEGLELLQQKMTVDKIEPKISIIRNNRKGRYGKSPGGIALAVPSGSELSAEKTIQSITEKTAQASELSPNKIGENNVRPKIPVVPKKRGRLGESSETQCKHDSQESDLLPQGITENITVSSISIEPKRRGRSGRSSEEENRLVILREKYSQEPKLVLRKISDENVESKNSVVHKKRGVSQKISEDNCEKSSQEEKAQSIVEEKSQESESVEDNIEPETSVVSKRRDRLQKISEDNLQKLSQQKEAQPVEEKKRQEPESVEKNIAKKLFVVPKRKGRPPKIPGLSSQKVSQEERSHSVTEIKYNEPEVAVEAIRPEISVGPKRRDYSRQKQRETNNDNLSRYERSKNPQEPQSLLHKIIDDNVEPKNLLLPKRRGRPRKISENASQKLSQPKEAQFTEEQKSQEPESIEENINLGISIVPKRRPRARKTFGDNAQKLSQKEEVQSIEEKTPQDPKSAEETIKSKVNVVRERRDRSRPNKATAVDNSSQVGASQNCHERELTLPECPEESVKAKKSVVIKKRGRSREHSKDNAQKSIQEKEAESIEEMKSQNASSTEETVDSKIPVVRKRRDRSRQNQNINDDNSSQDEVSQNFQEREMASSKIAKTSIESKNLIKRMRSRGAQQISQDNCQNLSEEGVAPSIEEMKSQSSESAEKTVEPNIPVVSERRDCSSQYQETNDNSSQDEASQNSQEHELVRHKIVKRCIKPRSLMKRMRRSLGEKNFRKKSQNLLQEDKTQSVEDFKSQSSESAKETVEPKIPVVTERRDCSPEYKETNDSPCQDEASINSQKRELARRKIVKKCIKSKNLMERIRRFRAQRRSQDNFQKSSVTKEIPSINEMESQNSESAVETGEPKMPVVRKRRVRATQHQVTYNDNSSQDEASQNGQERKLSPRKIVKRRIESQNLVGRVRRVLTQKSSWDNSQESSRDEVAQSVELIKSQALKSAVETVEPNISVIRKRRDRSRQHQVTNDDDSSQDETSQTAQEPNSVLHKISKESVKSNNSIVLKRRVHAQKSSEDNSQTLSQEDETRLIEEVKSKNPESDEETTKSNIPIVSNRRDRYEKNQETNDEKSSRNEPSENSKERESARNKNAEQNFESKRSGRPWKSSDDNSRKLSPKDETQPIEEKKPQELESAEKNIIPENSVVPDRIDCCERKQVTNNDKSLLDPLLKNYRRPQLVLRKITESNIKLKTFAAPEKVNCSGQVPDTNSQKLSASQITTNKNSYDVVKTPTECATEEDSSEAEKASGKHDLKKVESLPQKLLITNIERKILSAPKKRVRFDDESIRRCIEYRRNNDPSSDEDFTEPLPKRHYESSLVNRHASSLKVINVAVVNDDESNDMAKNEDLESSDLESLSLAHRLKLLEHQEQKISITKGINGVVDRAKSAFHSSDYISLDFSSLQATAETFGRLNRELNQDNLRESARQLCNEHSIYADDKLLITKIRLSDFESLRSTTNMPFSVNYHQCPIGHEKTFWDHDPQVFAFVQLQEPKILLKRLSRDFLKGHGLAYRPKTKIFVKILKKSTIHEDEEFRLPAYDGAADLSSTDTDEEDPDVTIACNEKRVCVYGSTRKMTLPKYDSTITPKKRKLNVEADEASSQSNKRRAISTTSNELPKTPYSSPSRTSMLKSPGRISGKYSPLKIIVTSPKVRREITEPRLSIQSDNSDDNAKASLSSSSCVTTPRRKNSRLHDNMLRGRFSIVKSTNHELGDKHAIATTMGPDGLGELDGIQSKGQTKHRTIGAVGHTSDCEELTRIQSSTSSLRDGKEARKKLIFSYKEDQLVEIRNDTEVSNVPDLPIIESKESSKLEISREPSASINGNDETDKVSRSLINPGTMMFYSEPGTSRDHANVEPENRGLYEVTTEEESNDDDDDVYNVTFTQYVNSQINKNNPSSSLERTSHPITETNKIITIMPKFQPPSRQRIIDTMETYGIPKFRNQEPFFSDPADVPKQKELAHKMLKVSSKSFKDLPTFVSSVDGVTGLARWRKMMLKEFHPSLAKSKDHIVKLALAGNERVVMTPLVEPPSQKQVKNWLIARKYLEKKMKKKKEKEDEDEEESKKKLREKQNVEIQGEILDRDENDERSSNASRSSHIEPSPERTLVSKELEKTQNVMLQMKLAKKELFKRVESVAKDTNDSQKLSSSGEHISTTHDANNSTEMNSSLLSVLEKSRLFRDQGASRHLGISCGQIEFLSDSTRSNVANENLQNAKALTRYQYLTIMCLEVHITTRGDLLPDAQHDPIAAIFYSVQNDVPPTSAIKPLEHGVIVLADEEKSKNKMYYSNSSNIPWTISFANNEEALLNSLVNLITRVDPEILIGWELETLSWGYVFQRASRLGVNLSKRISRIPTTQCKWEAQALDIETLAEVKLPGRIVLDIWRLMRHEAALLSYTFESVIHHVLNERISCPSFKILTNWWNLEKSRPSRWRVIEHYSIRVLGVFRILDQLDIIGRTSELARLFGIQFYEVFTRGSQFRVESVMLRLAKPLNYIAVSPSAQQRASMRAMEALPLIMEPESMFYSDPLIVLDFQSLYPSIIIAHNYCFSTCLGRIEHIGQPQPFEFGAYTLRVPKATAMKLQGKVNYAPCGVAFVKPEIRLGILPRMLTEILETRFMVKKAMKDHKKDDKTLQRALHSRQMGLKFLANVTYGYTAANFSGRMPCIEVGDSVISKSKETLERAIKLVETTPKWGARVVYGDTDSLFILVPGKSKADAFVIGNEIADAVTASNPPPIKLKFEKVMYPAILQTKKRYCGYMYETPEQEKPTYLAKGIETVRRDGCPAVSKILEKTLKILFDTKDVTLVKKYVTRQLDKVLRGKVSIQDLTFAKEFRGLKGYRARACVPALELTRRLMKKDPRAVPRNNERVRYVIVAGAPNQALIHCVRTPWELINDPGLRPNAIYYVTRVIIPPLNRCLNLMGVDVNAWYREMPHRQILDNPVARPSDKQKLTIFQYFGTIVCVACGQSSNKGICMECLATPADTLVIIHEKLRWLNRTNDHVTAICQSCIGRADDADCASLDCPVFYRRAQARRELSQSIQLREIIECGNNLEF